jgi:hypothetical protein
MICVVKMTNLLGLVAAEDVLEAVDLEEESDRPLREARAPVEGLGEGMLHEKFQEKVQEKVGFWRSFKRR